MPLGHDTPSTATRHRAQGLEKPPFETVDASAIPLDGLRPLSQIRKVERPGATASAQFRLKPDLPGLLSTAPAPGPRHRCSGVPAWHATGTSAFRDRPRHPCSGDSTTVHLIPHAVASAFAHIKLGIAIASRGYSNRISPQAPQLPLVTRTKLRVPSQQVQALRNTGHLADYRGVPKPRRPS